jgi:hypothetical protein
MSASNAFRHQDYFVTPNEDSFEHVIATELITAESQSFLEVMNTAGKAFHQAGVSRIILVHGTMAGTDALGWYSHWQRVLPRLSKKLKTVYKSVVDRLSGDRGNYTTVYAELLREGLNGPALISTAKGNASVKSPIAVELFNWTSENHHLGRANAAVRLADRVLDCQSNGERVMLWGHSHAGNVFAILSNLLADVDSRILKRFFGSTSHFLESTQRIDRATWKRLEERLTRGEHRAARRAGLDLVTFGTPIRYGWNSDGFDNLLHFVNHRPSNSVNPGRSFWPGSITQYADSLKGEYGDFVQQAFIAGTDFPPAIWSWNAWKANRILHRILQGSEHRIREGSRLLKLRHGLRVPDSGYTCLVDYATVDVNAKDICGHAVYTELDWMAFHVREIADRFYASLKTKI